MCQITEYNSENTIIHSIAVFNSSIHHIQVRFKPQATINGITHLLNFLTRPSSRFLLSIFSPLTLAATIQKIKSTISIMLITNNPSWLIQK
jgi:hypothetical protein